MDTFCRLPSKKAPPASTSLNLGYPQDLNSHFEFVPGEKLGKGGFGTVYLVQKIGKGEKFACKEIQKALDAAIATPMKQRKHIENVEREVAVLKKLKGSLNVVNLEAVYEDDSAVYIITECCFGGELIHKIGLRPYSEQTVAKIMKAVMRTLAQCHERGILHRDIKPGNFMFLRDDPDSPIKAIDFGLAVFYEKDKLPRKDLGFDGTPWFMAPEVLVSQVVPASDVWSAGVMAYQLLSGLLPFDDHKARHAPALSAVWASVLNDNPNFSRRCWSEISKNAKDFIQKLLHKDPTKRPTAEEALSHAWLKKISKRRPSSAVLSHTIVQRIQRFGQSSLFKRTVLDMIANELLQSYVEKTKYNEKQFLKRCFQDPNCCVENKGGNTEHSQTQAIEVLKGLNMRRAWSSSADLHGSSPMSVEDWEVVKRSSRLALDTSHHGSDAYGSFKEPSPFHQSTSGDVPMMDAAPYEQQSLSPPAHGIPLQAVLEKEPLPTMNQDNDAKLKGRSLYKEYIESQGQLLSDARQEVEAPRDQRTQRIEQFMKSVFGIKDANETNKVMEFLNFGISSHVSEKELVAGLEKLGYEVDHNEISILVEIMAPGSDTVNFTQFMASQIDWESLQQTHKEAWLECVQHAFDTMDKDKDGMLSSRDILSAISEKLPNKSDIDTALEQACAEAYAAELNLTFEDFLSLLRDDETQLPLRNFDSRYNDSEPT